MIRLPRRSLLCALVLGALSPMAWSQVDNFPNRPIKLVVNFPPGGNADITARLFGKKFSEVLKTPVVVDNKGGAGGTIGADAVAKAEPDGYTLLLTPYSILTNKNPTLKLPYNPVEDFVPVTAVTIAPLAFTVSAESKIKSLADLAAFSKNNRLSYGTYGPMTTTHIGQHRLAQHVHAKDALAIAYRGEAPMLGDFLGGQIQMGAMSLASARENEKTGKVHILGITGPTRSEFLPNVPTFKELGVKGMDWIDGVVVFASSKTPPAILARLQAAGKQVMQDEATLKAFRAQPNQPWLDITPSAMKAQMASDTAFWDKAQLEVGDAK